ncbi:mariner Mos1 transposase [Nephila pilipes]|uniref:Mariner Mos1 transposase n=1 Tax=Nephila pilipes TaxID=299642 RepID=A0A8X6N838_NEPPI|nr:mariner Mos1 transposase [Nephila pilipes]
MHSCIQTHNNRQIANELDISRRNVHEINADHLQFHKICARWMRRLLTEKHKVKLFESAFAFLQLYQNEGDEFLDTFVIEYKIWIHHFSPEMKCSALKILPLRL